jgi:protein TonB
LPAIPAITLSEEPPTGIGNGNQKEMPAPPAEFVDVDQMPAFKGGLKALAAYPGCKLRYPPDAQKNGVEGSVVVTFVVNDQGGISDVKVIKASVMALKKQQHV